MALRARGMCLCEISTQRCVPLQGLGEKRKDYGNYPKPCRQTLRPPAGDTVFSVGTARVGELVVFEKSNSCPVLGLRFRNMI